MLPPILRTAIEHQPDSDIKPTLKNCPRDNVVLALGRQEQQDAIEALGRDSLAVQQDIQGDINRRWRRQEDPRKWNRIPLLDPRIAAGEKMQEETLAVANIGNVRRRRRDQRNLTTICHPKVKKVTPLWVEKVPDCLCSRIWGPDAILTRREVPDDA
jgi:hypothetical protein